MINNVIKIDKATRDFISGDKDVRVVTDELSSDLGTIYPLHCACIDIPLGGGIAAGKIYEFFGEFSGGKTTWALSTVKSFAEFWEAMKDPMHRILWIESESALDKIRAAFMGVPVDKMIFFETDVLEEGHKKIKQYLKRAADKGMKLFVVWDTIAAVLTAKEKEAFVKASKEKKPKEDQTEQEQKEEKEDGKSKTNPGGLMEKPRLIRKMLADITLDLGKSHSTLIVLNQATVKTTGYQPTVDSSGGHGLKHFSSVRGKVIKVEESTYKHSSGQERKYIITKIEFRKNKLTGYTKYDINLWIDLIEGVDVMETRLLYMKANKILPRANQGWTELKIPSALSVNGKPSDLVEIKWQTTRQLNELVANAYPHLPDWFDYQIYKEFAKDSPLVKIRNIDKIWSYELKFFGTRKTILDDREKMVAKLLFEDLIKQSEKEEAEEAKAEKEIIKAQLPPKKGKEPKV